MTAQSLFFQEATLILASSLNISDVLHGFFKILQREMPVTHMGMGRYRLDMDSQELVAICSDEGMAITPPGKLAALSTAQVSMRSSLEPIWSAPEGVMVTDAGHPLARYYALGSGAYATAIPPFFHLRLLYAPSERGQRKQIASETPAALPHVGAVVFRCTADNPFTERHLDLLRSLRLPLRMCMDNCFQHRELYQLKENMRVENERLHQQLSGLSSVDVVGGNEGLAAVMERVRLAAAVDVPVLVTGETGTGKELIARAVHDLSPRREHNFVAVNCGGIPPSLIDSELFGHVKGAFTGATYNHKGRFERAHGGTIFLDEIGELPLDVQARLLRVLQEMTIERVGGNAAVSVDFRLVVATHRDLTDMVRKGTFREDLFYRLNVVPIHVPPLRERLRDIPLLVDHLVRRGAARFGITPPQIAPGELAGLLTRSWPGNVRELQNTVEEALVLYPQGPLRFRREQQDDKSHEHTGAGTGAVAVASGVASAVVSWESMQTSYFQTVLAATAGRINGEKGAAALTGLNPSTFRFKLSKLGIPFGRNS